MMSSKLLNKLGFFAIFAIGLSACNGNKPLSEPLGTSVITAQGTFSETSEVSANQTPVHADCAATGGVIDARLAVGNTFESTYKSINGTKVSKVLNIRARILSVDPANLKESVLPVSASGMMVTAGQEEPLTCSYDAQGKGTCVQPSFVALVAETTNGQYNNCTITGKNSDVINQRSSVGKFKLTGGQVIDAYLITRLAQGSLVCNGREMGGGDHYEVLILADGVSAEGAPSACGGTQIFHLDSYRNSLKRVLLGSSYERTLLPN